MFFWYHVWMLCILFLLFKYFVYKMSVKDWDCMLRNMCLCFSISIKPWKGPMCCWKRRNEYVDNHGFTTPRQTQNMSNIVVGKSFLSCERFWKPLKPFVFSYTKKCSPNCKRKCQFGNFCLINLASRPAKHQRFSLRVMCNQSHLILARTFWAESCLSFLCLWFGWMFSCLACILHDEFILYHSFTCIVLGCFGFLKRRKTYTCVILAWLWIHLWTYRSMNPLLRSLTYWWAFFPIEWTNYPGKSPEWTPIKGRGSAGRPCVSRHWLLFLIGLEWCICF